ncbi:unnamed protein product [Prunus armeniaca]|uniref:Pentatricopeptide repeat-containing protein n=1 Tax=Prunus armeniaca TaxID=36596 RepID=A0A6J5TH78_PRUAR|nr:unnamed protein product [Prunus armeniaca]
MPYTPWPAILRSLLSDCRIRGNIELGEWTAKNLVPENDVSYVLLSKVYSEGGSWEDATNIRREMIEGGVPKNTGYSWIEFLATSDEAELDGPLPTSGLSTKRAVAKANDQPTSTCKKLGTGRTKLTGGTNNAKFAPENPYAPLLSAKCY